MAQSNVDVVRAAFEAFLAGDERTMFALTAPDVLVTQFPDQVDTRDYLGRDGLREVMAAWIGSWDGWSIELVRAWEVDSLVFATAFQRGRGRTSGAPMATEVTFIFTVRDGLIVRWRMFRSEAEARAASGLEAASDE